MHNSTQTLAAEAAITNHLPFGREAAQYHLLLQQLQPAEMLTPGLVGLNLQYSQNHLIDITSLFNITYHCQITEESNECPRSDLRMKSYIDSEKC